MRKKRFIACLLVILVLAVSAVALVACKPENSPITFPDVPVVADGIEEPGVGDLLLYLLKGMGNPDKFVSMDFESDIAVDTTGNSKYGELPVWGKFYLKGNFLPDEKDADGNVTKTGEVQLAIGVKQAGGDGSQDFEILMHNGRFYLKAAGTSLYLEDIDFRWVIEQIKKIGELQNLVDTIFGMIDGLDINSDVDELVGLVAMLMFQIDENATTYNPATNSGHIALKLEPTQLIGTVVGALGGTSIDEVLGSVGLTLRDPNGNPIYIDNFLKTLVFPNINVYVEGDVEPVDSSLLELDPKTKKEKEDKMWNKNHKLVMYNEAGERTGLRLNVYDYKSGYYEMATSAEFGQDKIDVVPENISKYVPFGLLKLQFDTAFSMHVNDLDAGKVVNFFAGAGFLPENSFVLTLNADIDIKVDIDLRLKKDKNGEGELEDNGLMCIEIYEKGESDPLLGIYLKNEKLYVNLDNFLKMSSDKIDLDIMPGNIVVSGVNIADWATRGLNMATELVGKIIDSIFPPKKAEAAKSLSTVAATDDIFRPGYSKEDLVLAVSSDGNGKAIFSNTIGSILDIVRYTTALEDFFTYDSEEGKINLCVNNKFFDKLCDHYGLNVPELKGKEDFGAINISVNFNESGFDNIELDVNFNEKLGGIKANVVIDNFAYGFGHHDELDAYIIDRITKDEQYVGNLHDLVYRALDDLDLQFTAKLNIPADEYHTNNILGFDTGLPDIKIEVHKDFVLELVLKIQIEMKEVFVGYETDDNGVETDIEKYEKIITRAYIGITNKTKNPIFPKDNMTVRLTYIDVRDPENMSWGTQPIGRAGTANGLLFVDMSEFSMVKIGIPSFVISIDLTDTLFGLLGDLDMNFEIPDFMKDVENKYQEFIKEKFPNKKAAAQTFAASDDVTASADYKTGLFTYALFSPATSEQTSRFLKLNITTEIINKIFEMIAPTLPPEVTLPALPNLDLTATIDEIEGINLSIKANDGGERDITLDLIVDKFKMGKQNVINIKDFVDDYNQNPTKFGEPIDLGGIIESGGNAFMGILGDIIYRALDDVNISMSLDIHLNGGTYDLSNLFGNDTTLPPIPITVSENGADINLELSIKIQSAMVNKLDEAGNIIPNEFEQIISRAIIELKIAPNALITSGENSAVRLIYLDDRYEPNKEYVEERVVTPNGRDIHGETVYNATKTHGTMFVQLSSIELMKLSLPDLAFDLDLNEIIAQVIDKINLSDLTISNNNYYIENPVQRLLSAVADGDGTEEDGVSYVKVAFTTQLINKLLIDLGVNLEFNLPNDIDGGLVISSEDGISISISATESGKLVSAKLALGNLQLGTNLTDADIAIPEGFDKNNFGSPATLDLNALLNTVIYRALDDVELEFDLKFKITKGTYYVDKLFAMFNLNVNGETLPIKVNEDFILDLTLKIQIRWNNFVDEKQNPIAGSGITQALVSLYNKQPNIFFQKADAENPVLTAMYIDDRGPNNASLPNNNFRYGMHGKKTHGTLFVDLSGFEFAKLKFPNIAVDLDLTKTITDLLGKLNFSDLALLNGNDTVESLLSETMSRALSTVANEGEETKNDNNYLNVAITMKLLQDLLNKFNVTLELPDLFEYLNGDLTISQIDGLKIHVNLPGADESNQGNEIDLSLGIKKIQLGRETTISVAGLSHDYFASFGTRCIDSIDAILYRILDDTDIEMKLTANVPVGKYNVAPLLKLAGIDIDQLMLEFEEIMKVDLKLSVQLQMETVMTENEQGAMVEKTILARAKIELISYEQNFIVDGSEQGISVLTLYYFDDRWSANMTGEAQTKLNLVKCGDVDKLTGNVKETHGTLFAKFDGLSIANIAIPSIKMDIDLTETILDSIMGAVGSIGVTLGQDTMANNSRLSTVGDIMLLEETDTTDLGNYIQVSIVTGLLNEILRLLNVDLGIKLPDFGVDLGAFTESGITVTIWVDADDVNQTEGTNRIDAMLSFPKLSLGQKTIVDINSFYHSNYTTDFSNLVMSLLQYGHIEADINIGANASQVNIQRLLNELLMTSGIAIQWPITVDLNDFANTITLKVQWEFDYNIPENSKIIIEAKCDGFIIAGIYAIGGNVYCDLSGLGLPKFALTNSNLVAKVVNLISKELDGLLGGLLNTGTANLQQAAADAYGMSVQEMNTQLFINALDDEEEGGTTGGVDIMSYVTLLLNGMSVKDGIIHGEFAADLIANLLSDLSINLSNDISLDVSVDIFSGNLKLNARIDELTIGAELRIMNIGGEEHIDESDIVTSGYDELNASTGSMFVTTLLDALEPGLWMDLVSKNETISDDFKYTKLTMRKVGPKGENLQYTTGGWANGGSILLSLLAMDGVGNANGLPMLYVILDINGGEVRIRATNNLLPHVTVAGIVNLDPDTMVNIGIPLDIKGALTDLLGPIIAEINRVDTTNNANSDISTTGDKELGEIFSNIDFMSILKEINIKIFGVRNIKIGVELEASFVNNLLPNLINNGLNGMSINLGGKNSANISGLKYETGKNQGFLENFWNQLIYPVVEAAAADAGFGGVIGLAKGTIESDIKPNVLDLVQRLLPFPKLNTLNANVHIINGKLDNISVIAYGDGADRPQSQNRVELTIFNDNDSDGGGQVLFGTMEVGKLNDIVFQAPYVHFDASVDNPTNFANKFTATAYKSDKGHMYYETERNGSPTYLTRHLDVTWNITYYNPTSLNSDNQVSTLAKTGFTRDDMSAFMIGARSYRTGYYIARVTVTLKSGQTRYMDVRVVIEDNQEFLNAATTTVDKIEVRAGESIPDAVTFRGLDENGKEKTVYVRKVDGAMDKFTITGATKQGLHDHTVTGKITVKFQDGSAFTPKDVVVHYFSSNFALVDTTPIEISVMEYMDFFNSLYSVSGNNYEYKKVYVQTQNDDGSNRKRIYQNVENITYSTELFKKENDKIVLKDGKPVLSGNVGWTNANGFSTSITYTMEDQHGEQTPLVRDVIVKPRIVSFARLDSKNTVLLDSLQTANDLPKTARIFFANGDERTFSIESWDFSGATENINGVDTSVKFEFGVDKVYDNISFTFRQDADTTLFGTTGAKNVVNGITIAIADAKIQYAITGENDGEYCNITYEDFADRKFGDFDLKLVSSTGRVVDYLNDKIEFVVGYVKDAIPDGANANDYLTGAGKQELYNTQSGRDEYNRAIAACTINDGDSDELKAKKNNELARWHVVTETVLNYEVVDSGVVVGNDGGKVKVRIILKNMVPDNINKERPIDESSKYTETYIYFNVAKPIVFKG